ncbi:MAG: CoA-binding protein [Candidatus Nezhaarchaeota archaeon]|nr:CoA-binding protein [Candidatus Nezhaarchaeota archaeon]
MKMEKLKPLFYPNSVAIVGASDNPISPGYLFVMNLVGGGYEGNVYPVNPRLAGRELLGVKCYARISDIPDEVDFALISVSAYSTINVLKECGAKGVKVAVIFAGGFSESRGDEGRRMEVEMRRIAEETGMIIVGPNCLGVVNPSIGLNTAIGIPVPKEPGKIAFISHSGGLLESFLALSVARGFHVSKAISTGNEAVTTLNDCLEYFIEDPETSVVAMYIEAVRDGRRFLELCSSTIKPLVALKAGRTGSGKMAARSHTAALAGSIDVWNAACKQAGIIQAKTFEELYDLSMALACPLRPKGNRVGIISVSGGFAVVAADACEELGLLVPKLTNDNIDKLRKILPPFASASNPVDLTASAFEDVSLSERVLEAVCSDPNIDVIMVTPPLVLYQIEVAELIVDAIERYQKPIIVAWAMPFGFKAIEFEEVLRLFSKNLVPNYYTPERAAKAIITLASQAEIEKKKLSRYATNKSASR